MDSVFLVHKLYVSEHFRSVFFLWKPIVLLSLLTKHYPTDDLDVVLKLDHAKFKQLTYYFEIGIEIEFYGVLIFLKGSEGYKNKVFR